MVTNVCSLTDVVDSQTTAVVQVWRKEKAESGFLTVELKKSETKEVVHYSLTHLI